MSPNRNASTSKSLNQARNLTHSYLQARGQPATLSSYAHIQAPGGRFQSINFFFPPTQDSISATNRTKVIRNEDKGMCLSSAKLTFIVHIEVHLPNGEDEDDDEATVQKNSKKTPKASKEAKGN
ncbi:hypothetical protein CROQUDRAFT_665808 [Cronartium quercuum f. sp. fusiforme G11]|uniref:Uncharacterized protein n=1 Tax=Cronartium quercuum f. sp. fusiforme G11 TaxID=708437 RepID=A0A9P6T5V5_9BASI|nr:hypothetical protein CROQUDRAFT_665808 [Cronartium quercuum f. sp. fusiforme G11]